MRSKLAVAVMALVLALYLALVMQRALQFMGTGVPVAVAIGVALLVLPLIGFWALGMELLFGLRTQRLLGELDGPLPADTLPLRPSGRPVRAAADEAFPAYEADARAHPESWAAWLRLGLAYEACGDRRRARAAIRRAIRLERAA